MSQSDMKDICVYTKPETLDHKKKDGLVYWQFNNMPSNLPELEKDGRIYFAVKGFIVGYFLIELVNEFDKQVDWQSETWVDLETPVPQRPFQGFKYIERGTV